MKLNLAPYFFLKAFQNISKNRLIHVISVSTMAISLLIFGTFLLLFININGWVHQWGTALNMSVYLKDGVGKNTKQNIRSQIESLPGVTIREYVTKDKAMEDLIKSLGPESGLLEGLSENPLPASFEVVFKDVDLKKREAQTIAENLEMIEGVDEVQYSEEWLKRFAGIIGVIRLVGFIIGGLLCVGVLFIVTNTIKLTIYSRREEIEILKLVGATDWFVKTPFLLEGIIHGVLSGLLAILGLFFGYLLLSAKKAHLLGLTILDFSFIPQEYVISIFLVSLGLGLVGSFIAVGRFLTYEKQNFF